MITGFSTLNVWGLLLLQTNDFFIFKSVEIDRNPRFDEKCNNIFLKKKNVSVFN